MIPGTLPNDVVVEALSVARRSDGRPILDGVSLSFQPGHLTALVGPSGCGKTTLLLALMDLLPPGLHRIAGRFELEGQDFFSRPSEERRALKGDRLAYVPQQPLSHLCPSMRVVSQVAEVVRFHRSQPRTKAQSTAITALTAEGLPPDRLNAYPHELSGGQRQRVLLAMASVLEPSVLLVDEPTTALDPLATRRVLTRIQQQARRGAAVLWVTHERDWAHEFADVTLAMA